MKEFKDRDVENNGKISVLQWSEAMEVVTNFKLPWRLLRDKLTVSNEANEILYEKTLEMIDSDDLVRKIKHNTS